MDPSFDAFKRVPPVTANIGQACYACFKDQGDGVNLQKCAKCRIVRYCGAGCQKPDWAKHKAFCKALSKIANSSSSRATSGFSLAHESPMVPNSLNTIIESDVQKDLRTLQINVGRPLTIPERNLLGWEPRCMGCGRSDRLLRMEASSEESGSSNTTPTLNSCTDCRMAFYCSKPHWAAVQHRHAGEPCEDGHDGLSQCEINQEIRADVKFSNAMAGVAAGPFRWAPEHVKPAWTSLRNISWEGEFGADLAQQLRVPVSAVGTWIRAASDSLSMPMTILWALENINTDDAWTQKDTLTIHILGAHELEVMNAQMFEEILHRLPKVKNLKLILCGPELSEMGTSSWNRGQVIDMETCPNCERSSRRRIHQHYDMTYHDYAKSLGNKYTKPDLAIAFNSGCSQEAVSSWKATISFLAANHIPSVFTAYNREEAESEADILRQAGAGTVLLPSLGPVKNVWGSTLSKKEPNKVTGFYSVNGWLAGGFQ